MSGQQLIEHDGIIQQIDGDVAHVKIDTESACGACHAKGVCGAADQEEKFLDIPLYGAHYTQGENVRVQVARNLGFRAVVIGYVYPFLLVMAVLVSLVLLDVNEQRAGLLALLSLIPYYLILYLVRKQIGSKFTFSLKKTSMVQ
jgi:sigma-E factor negative regulatory protein RseC